MRVLHALSQRPSHTGSGVTLDAIVRHAAATGWQQKAVVGVPVDDPRPEVGGLGPDDVHALEFGGGDLDFPVPGMSDVMPYPSTRFASMSPSQIEVYCTAWSRHLRPILDEFRPQIIHSHHVWLLSSLLKDLAPKTPVVTQCHATGLRQMKLVPRVAERVRVGCARNDAFLVLHRGHAADLERTLRVPSERIHVVGAGYRDELFHSDGLDPERPPALLYVGKYSAAKGLPWLLDAFERIAVHRPDLRLHIAGDGAGDEAEALRRRMTGMTPRVILHGQLPQTELARLMRGSTICVLPSFFEGLPLVLVEALACGCRLVATALPGIVEELAPHLGSALEIVELPEMVGVDTPSADSLPDFVHRLETALDRALAAPPLGDVTAVLWPFTWSSVFRRVKTVWTGLLEGLERSAGSTDSRRTDEGSSGL